jgi:hypothetical protein
MILPFNHTLCYLCYNGKITTADESTTKTTFWYELSAVSCGAFMNSNVRILTHQSGGKVGAKNAYIKGRQKGDDPSKIDVLIDNGFLDEKRLSDDAKKERKSLQKKLPVYRKRLESAIEEQKPKVIANSQKKIVEIQAKLNQPFVKSNKKEIIDMTFILTNAGKQWQSHKPFRKSFNRYIEAYIKREFEDLHIVTVASHFDQASPHTHALLQVPNDTSWSKYLREKYQVEDTRDAYRAIQAKFHDSIEQALNRPLDPLQSGRRYVGLGEYKAKGNFEVKLKEQSGSSKTAQKSNLSQNTHQTMQNDLKRLKSQFQDVFLENVTAETETKQEQINKPSKRHRHR